MKDVVEKLVTCQGDSETVKSGDHMTHFTVPRFKQRITVITPDMNKIENVLDACKVKIYVLITDNLKCFYSRCVTQ